MLNNLIRSIENTESNNLVTQGEKQASILAKDPQPAPPLPAVQPQTKPVQKPPSTVGRFFKETNSPKTARPIKTLWKRPIKSKEEDRKDKDHTINQNKK